MLEALRRGAQTWVAKLLFGLLVFSFAIWGVADVFRGWGQGSVAKVGGVPITAEEFNRAFQSELDAFSRRANKKLTVEQGRALGLDKRVLAQLVGAAAIEQHAHDLGLTLSDQTLVDMISSDPDFKGPDGKFSHEGFEAMLRQIGLNERKFLSLKRRDEIRTQLIGAFVKAQTVPMPLIEAMHAYDQEKRVFEYVNIDPEKAVTVGEPDEAKLRERYEAGKASFMTPEFRKVDVLILSIDDLKKSIEVKDDEIAAEYESSKETYDVPEKRRVQQIAFKDRAAAEAAKKVLEEGSKTFGEVAKEAGAKETDVDLGLITKSALIDPKVAEAAFSVEKDKISDVVEGRFATVIVRVTQIEPGTVKSLADVKDQVKDKLLTERARQQLQDTIDHIDDDRNAGKTLKEIAEARKLAFREVAATDKRALTPEGKQAFEGLDFKKLAELAFSSEPGGEHVTGELSDGSHVWINIISSEPPKQKSFEDVKEGVKSQYMTSERNRLIQDLATKLAERVNNGEPMSAIESAAGNTTAKSEPVTRKTVPQGLSEAAVTQGFALALNKAGTAESADAQSRTVLRVVEITPAAPPTKEEIEKLTKTLSADLANQALAEYTEALKAELGANVNEKELKRLTGAVDQ